MRAITILHARRSGGIANSSKQNGIKSREQFFQTFPSPSYNREGSIQITPAYQVENTQCIWDVTAGAKHHNKKVSKQSSVSFTIRIHKICKRKNPEKILKNRFLYW